jgi:hypothetical protein
MFEREPRLSGRTTNKITTDGKHGLTPMKFRAIGALAKNQELQPGG